jgi:hypothetical protein
MIFLDIAIWAVLKNSHGQYLSISSSRAARKIPQIALIQDRIAHETTRHPSSRRRPSCD